MVGIKTGACYLVDFLLRVGEERWEVAEGVTVEHYLRLFICAGHDIPNGPQGSSLNEEGKCKTVLTIKNKIGEVFVYLNVVAECPVKDAAGFCLIYLSFYCIL